jgi:hypothetical protein
MHSLPLAVSVFWSHIFTMKKSPSQTTSYQLFLYSITVYFYISIYIDPWLSIGVGFINHIWFSWLPVNPSEKSWTEFVSWGPVTFPTEWRVIQNSMVPVTTHQIPWLSPQTADLKICSWMTIWPSPTNLRTDGVSPCDIFLSKHRWNLSFIMIQMFKKIEKWWSWTWLIVIKIIYDKSE